MQAGTVFVLDEVITSRLGPGGLRRELGLEPDMVTLGKWLGGGMPFGAFGGREDIIGVFDPRMGTALSHSGTFQNNTMMLNAGYVALSEVYTPEVAKTFNEYGDNLRQRLQKVVRGTRLSVTGRGSLLCIHATTSGLAAESITCKDDIMAVEDADLKRLLWLELLDAGFWVQMRGSIALNLPTPQEALDSLIEAVENFCSKYRELISL